MKNLITTIGSMIIIFIFLMQFVANQLTYTKILGTEMAVKSFRRNAETAGTISDTDITEVKNRISKAVKCDVDDVIIDFKPKDLSGEIEYAVKVPISDVIGASKILQLTKEDNQVLYTSSGTIYVSDEEGKKEEEEGT